MLKKSKVQVIKKDIIMADLGSCFNFILTYAGSLCLLLLCHRFNKAEFGIVVPTLLVFL